MKTIVLNEHLFLSRKNLRLENPKATMERVLSLVIVREMVDGPVLKKKERKKKGRKMKKQALCKKKNRENK